MNSKDCIREVRNITGILIREGLAESYNFPSIKTDKGVTNIEFEGSKDLSIALRNVPYSDIHKELVGGKRYNYKFPDDAFIQMAYSFNDKDRLIKHRLCYFPSPTFEPYQDEPDIYELDEIFADIVFRNVLPVPIRFDFDPKNAKELDHPHSHLTFGQYKNCRVPVIAPVRPTHFIQFILTSFYKKKYDQMKSGLGHDFLKKMPSTASKKEKSVLHMAL